MDRDTVIGWLRGSAAFGGAPDAALESLADSFELEREVPAGTEVVHEGDEGGDFYLLASGSLRVTTEKGGEERYLGNISVGETFGEIGSLTGGRRLASVTACEDSKLLILSQGAFQATLRAHPGLAESVLRSLERYLLP